jgi:hypothetical protein
LQALKALVQTVAFLIGVSMGGLPGALLAQLIALVAVHPAVILLARKHRAWDWKNDLLMFAIAGGMIALGLWVNGNPFVQI